jgi:hypothetical protein
MRRVVGLLQGRFLLEPREPLAVSAVSGAECVLGHQGRPIYAYVGDVHPQLGVIGLVLSRDWQMQDVSRCDTGGLFAGIGDFAGAGNQDAREQALHRLNFRGPSVSDWQAAFEAEIIEVHGGASNYVRGVRPELEKFPANDIRKECVAHGLQRETGSVDRRLWTWEGRTTTPPQQSHYLLLMLSSVAQEAFSQMEAEEQTVGVNVAIEYAPDDDSGISGMWRRPEIIYRWLLGEEE